jgi:molybdopterin synthase catalytic subunit
LNGLVVLHRFGRIVVGEPIVFVGAASRHRHAAFAAAEMLMDFLKSTAPFWKRAILADGAKADWVAASASDEEALKRWAEAKK